MAEGGTRAQHRRSDRRRPGMRALVAGALLLLVPGCGGSATAADLAASRDAVREAAGRDLPGVLAALGGQPGDAWGEYDLGGDGIADRRRYGVTVVVTGVDAGAGEIAASFEAAGYEVVQVDDVAGVVGERGDVTIGAGLPRGGELRLGVHGPWLEPEDGTERQVGREPFGLDLTRSR